jgi:anti-anti-sigma regulatory factor
MTTQHGDRGEGADEGMPRAGRLPGPTASLFNVSHAITGATDAQTLGNALTDEIRSYGVDSYILFRYYAGEEPTLEAIASWSKGEALVMSTGARFPASGHATLELLKPGNPFIVKDCATDPRLDETTRHQSTERGMRSLGIFPMSQGGELFGVLSLHYNTHHELTDEEIQGYGLLAQVTMVALQNIEGRALIAKKVARCNALYRIGAAIADIADEDSLFQKAAELLVTEIGYVLVWIAMVDEEAGLLRERALAGVGWYPGRPPSVYSLSERSMTAIQAIESGELRQDGGAQKKADDEGWGDVARAAGLRCMGHVPLRAGGRVLGVIGVGSADERLAEDELSLMGAFGGQLVSTVLRGQMSRERDKQMLELERAYADQERLLKTVHELSTPVIPVHDGVLVLPLVGMIDSSRSAQVMEALLNAIQQNRASVVIIDITGVPTVDTGVANHLLRSTRAAALLGATCVLVGVAPAVAQTLVQLGIDLGALVTRNNLQAGIAYALALRGRGRSLGAGAL